MKALMFQSWAWNFGQHRLWRENKISTGHPHYRHNVKFDEHHTDRTLPKWTKKKKTLSCRMLIFGHGPWNFIIYQNSFLISNLLRRLTGWNCLYSQEVDVNLERYWVKLHTTTGYSMYHQLWTFAGYAMWTVSKISVIRVSEINAVINGRPILIILIIWCSKSRGGHFAEKDIFDFVLGMCGFFIALKWYINY